MNTEITVTMTQEEAIQQLSEIMEDKFNHVVKVVIIGINDNEEAIRQKIADECERLIDKSSKSSKIEAIKHFRCCTGATLKSAKDIIDDAYKMKVFVQTGKMDY